MVNIDLRKKVRVKDAFLETLITLPLKELDVETFFYFLAKLSKAHKDDSIYYLSLKEFEELTGKQHNIYEYVKSFVRTRAITFTIKRDRGTLIDGLYSSAEIIEGTKTVEITLSPKMKPYLIGVVEDWTAPQLYSMMRMSSKHAYKIYLYLYAHRPKSGAFRAVVEYETIEAFKRKLGYIDSETGKEFYKKSGHFVSDVLEVAKKEINAVTDIRVAYKLKKLGREYNWIEWTIENKNNDEFIPLMPFQQKAVEEKTFSEQMDEVVRLRVLVEEFEVGQQTAQKILRMYAAKLVDDEIAIVRDIEKAGKIRVSKAATFVGNMKTKHGFGLKS